MATVVVPSPITRALAYRGSLTRPTSRLVMSTLATPARNSAAPAVCVGTGAGATSGARTSAARAMGCFIGRRRSGDDLAGHSARDVGEPEIAARVTVGELLVVEPQQVEE